MDARTPVAVVNRPTLGDVVTHMVKFAHKGKIDMDVRGLVERLCGGLESGDYGSEINAINNWVDQNIRYMRDIQDVEFLKEPGALLRARTGDCDDIATLIAAMLLACGNECVFSLVAFKGQEMPSHVFCCVKTADGLYACDPVARYKTANMLASATKRWDIPL
jgi:predicted transglutaminase-like cysteine proteinase